MTEKSYKKVNTYGKLKTLLGDDYWLISPFPVELDDWVQWPSEAWFVSMTNPFKSSLVSVNIDGIEHIVYPQPHILVCSFPVISLYDTPEIYVETIVEEEVKEEPGYEQLSLFDWQKGLDSVEAD
jgi:hypothetical protein